MPNSETNKKPASIMKDKVILITGGSGSLGRELTKQLLELDPKTIRILSNNEWELYDMQRHFTDSRLRYLLGDIRDRDRMQRSMDGVDIVIHAAALKHVSLCEYNPFEAVKTNILGSMNVIDAAIDNDAEKVIAISSDKAVHPINLYGATKLVMEKVFLHANAYYKTKFSCVRFGNFQGSRGSVLPLWYKQLEESNEITVTAKEMTRFWISLDKAGGFVLKCIKMMEGNETFIPKMPEVEIMELAKEFAPKAKIKIIGIRKGEKLQEMLLAEGEEAIETEDYFLIKGGL